MIIEYTKSYDEEIYGADEWEISIKGDYNGISLIDECIMKCLKQMNEPTIEPENEPEKDDVNHPSHYTHGGMECIDEMILLYGIEDTASYCKLAAHKYRKRSPFKNAALKDMKKSDWYLMKYKELKEEIDKKKNADMFTYSHGIVSNIGPNTIKL